MAKKKSKEVPWTFEGKEMKKIPEEVMGFIYKITTEEGRFYYGRKTVWSTRKKKLTKKEKLEPENKRKTFKRELTESNWKKYTGSSKPLNEDIKKGISYKKEIITFCASKAEMTFYEARAILCSNALLTDQCYNDWGSFRVYKKHLLSDK